jgi:hypothetical protein
MRRKAHARGSTGDGLANKWLQGGVCARLLLDVPVLMKIFFKLPVDKSRSSVTMFVEYVNT